MDGGPSTGPSDHGMMSSSTAPTSSRVSPSPRSPANHFNPNTSTDNAPPYWTRAANRNDTQASFDSLAGRGITMADNTTDTSETNAACWAKSVTITDHSEVKGGALNVGAFVVWHITIETLSVRPFVPALTISLPPPPPPPTHRHLTSHPGFTNPPPQAVLRLRHPPSQPSHDLPSLRSIDAAIAAEGGSSEVQTQFFGEEGERVAVFFELCAAESGVCEGASYEGVFVWLI